jgi:hypothetical protein
VAKIKPAIEELMTKYVCDSQAALQTLMRALHRHQLTAQFDPHNAGVLIVSLNRPNQGMSGDEIADRVDRNDCIIM